MSPVLFSGMLYPIPYPLPWSCLYLISGFNLQSASLFFSLGCCIRLLGLVSGLFSRDAVSDSLLLFPNFPICSSAWDGAISQLVLQPGMLYPAPWSCLLSCFPGCCVRFPGLVFVLSPVLFPNLVACSSAWDAAIFQLVLQPGMLCPAPWSYLYLISNQAYSLINFLVGFSMLF